MSQLEKQVKEKLKEQHGYDFASEFWTDENIVMLQEIVGATEEVIHFDSNGMDGEQNDDFVRDNSNEWTVK